MLSRTAGYALHATVAVAERGAGGDPVRAAEFSFLMAIPTIAGAAVLQLGDLSAERLDQRGSLLPGGAFREIGESLGQCLLGRGTCSEVGGCPAHREWREASAPAFHFFESRTVADLMTGHDSLP